MNLHMLRMIQNRDNVIENMAYGLLEYASNQNDLINFLGMSVAKSLDLRMKRDDEAITILKTIAQQNSDSFGGIVTFAIYLNTMESRNTFLMDNNPSIEMINLIYDVDLEIRKNQRTIQQYLLHNITKGPYVQELFRFLKLFDVSNKFHDNLHDYVSPYQTEIIEYLINYYKHISIQRS